MPVGVLVPIISGLVAALVVYWLSKTVREEPKQHSNRHRVEYGSALKILSAVFFPLSAFVTYAALHASSDQKTLALIIAICFWVGTVYLAYGFFFVSLSFDDEYIYHRTPLHRERRIPWSAITHVHYSAASQVYRLKTDGYGDVVISILASGVVPIVRRAITQRNNRRLRDNYQTDKE